MYGAPGAAGWWASWHGKQMEVERDLAQTLNSRLWGFLEGAKAGSGGDSSQEAGLGTWKQISPSCPAPSPQLKCTGRAGSCEGSGRGAVSSSVFWQIGLNVTPQIRTLQLYPQR